MTTDIIYRYKNQVYFNITNKCPCRCTFCIRNTEDAIGEASNLWFEHEPALEEIYKAIPNPKLVVAAGSCALMGGV